MHAATHDPRIVIKTASGSPEVLNDPWITCKVWTREGSGGEGGEDTGVIPVIQVRLGCSERAKFI